MDNTPLTTQHFLADAKTCTKELRGTSAGMYPITEETKMLLRSPEILWKTNISKVNILEFVLFILPVLFVITFYLMFVFIFDIPSIVLSWFGHAKVRKVKQ
jgi:hypothetical protein